MIVIPMVGRSSRFFEAGYHVPKFQLPLDGYSVFFHAIDSFRHYFDSEEFLFLVRDDFSTREFVERELEKLEVSRYEVRVFDEDTRGQAETVFLGTKDVPSETSLSIFNIDTFRPNFRKAGFAGQCHGYLEVFRGDGEHWSFVSPGDNNKVVRTTEKERISDLCSDGFYYFREKSLFDLAFDEALVRKLTVKDEYYIAPLYNILVQKGFDIRYELIARSEVVFCGTPGEYHGLLDSFNERESRV